jgi:HAE1 family hydrophobic/amphiphilic exporter-1
MTGVGQNQHLDSNHGVKQLSATIALSPTALGLGAGSDTNGPLAVAVIGGLVSSTLLTLVVIPSVYSLVEHKVERFRL